MSPQTNVNKNRPMRGKPLKRLHSNVRNKMKFTPNNQRTSLNTSKTLHHHEINYQTELASFVALRHSDPQPSTSTGSQLSAIPSQELIWVRDESSVVSPTSQLQTPNIQLTARDDSEIEEGEIVESEVTGIVNLLEESFAAVRQSQKIEDCSSLSKLFYEDRSAVQSYPVPQYTTFGTDENDESLDEMNTSDDVICLDSTQSDVDDSVIFVSEEKLEKGKVQFSPLGPPECLKSPAVKNLLNLVPSPPGQSSKRNTPKRKLRMALWKQKKAMEYADINIANGKKVDLAKLYDLKASTSTDLPNPETAENHAETQPATKVETEGLEKRIILIDGSNVAMSFTDNYGAKKTDKDFSAEGK